MPFRPQINKYLELFPEEWREFFESLYAWKDLEELLLKTLLHAELSYMELDEICEITRDLLSKHISAEFSHFLTNVADIICGDSKTSNYFWEMKTRQDFGDYYENIQEEEGGWYKTYEHYRILASRELINASEAGDVERVMDLLEMHNYGRMLNLNLVDSSGNNTALIGASLRGNLEIVLALVDAGVDPSDKALKLARREGHEEVALILSEAMRSAE